jgi:hypothetical protein
MSEESAFPTGYEKADSSAVPQNDILTHSLSGEREQGRGSDRRTLPHPDPLAHSNVVEGDCLRDSATEWVEAEDEQQMLLLLTIPYPSSAFRFDILAHFF